MVFMSSLLRMSLSALIFLAPLPLAAQDSSTDLEALRNLVQQQQSLIEDLQARLETLEREQDRTVSTGQPEASQSPVALPQPALKNELRAYWDDGLHLQSEDAQFRISIGGRLHADAAWFDHSRDFKTIGAAFPEFGIGDEQDGAEFRRARLSLTGRAFDYLDFRAEFDFAADAPGESAGKFREVFLGISPLPYLGSVRVGHFKEPFSLEEVGTDNATTFMERGLPNALVPSYNMGLAFQRTFARDRLQWSAGVFRTTDDWPSAGDANEEAGYNVTTRLTGLPWYQPEQQRLLHLGLSFSHRNPDGPLRFRQRPEANLANVYLDTHPLHVETVNLYGLEAALVHGPLSLQGEYIHADADTTYLGRRDFSGYYVQGSWFLTGESRPYSSKSATFGTVVPHGNFHPTQHGWGAWELALRYSGLDLDSGLVWGGTMENYSLGLNWYLNPNARVMLNYVHSDVEHRFYDGRFHALMTRFQVHF